MVQFYSWFIIFVYFYLSSIRRYTNLFLQKYNILTGRDCCESECAILTFVNHNEHAKTK